MYFVHVDKVISISFNYWRIKHSLLKWLIQTSHVQLFATPWTEACQVSLSLTISQKFGIIYTFFFHFKETRLLLIKENVWKLLKPVILPIFSRFTVSKLKFTLSNSNAWIWSYTQSAKCFLYNESLHVHHPHHPKINPLQKNRGRIWTQISWSQGPHFQLE